MNELRKNVIKIESARITEQPKKYGDPLPEVWVLFEDGVEEFLFDYYPDEISFSPSEFVGKTVMECLKLKGDKDRRYLQSNT